MKNCFSYLLIRLGLSLIFFSFGWAPQAKAFSFFSKDPTPALISEGKTLVIVVAPFDGKNGESTEGRKVQKDITEEFRRDTDIKVIELSHPVSLGSNHTLETGFAGAEQILSQTGADLLIWGDQRDVSFGQNWNTYFSVSAKVQSTIREEGFSMHRSGFLSGISENDTVELVRWIVSGWAGLIEKSRGIAIAPKLQEMTTKIYSLLGSAHERNWKQRTIREIKRSLSIPLCSYANETHDIPTLRKAVQLLRDVLESYSKSEQSFEWADDENMLGLMLGTLGESEESPQDLLEAVKADRNFLRFWKRKENPLGWAVTETNLGNALLRLGQRQSGDENNNEAIKAYKAALTETSPVNERDKWVNIQNGLATAYSNLGEKTTDDRLLQTALDHYQAALKEAKAALAPTDVALLQYNTSTVYLRLGERQNNEKYFQRAIDLNQQAIVEYRRIHYAYALATALSGLGCQEMDLAHLKGDNQALLNMALASMKESIVTLPKELNPLLWANNRINMGIISRLFALKKMDRSGLLEALQAFEDVQTVNQKATMPFQWAQTSTQKGGVYALLGEAYGDPDYLLKGEAALREALKIFDPQNTPADWMECNYDLGLIQMVKGLQTKDVPLLREAIEKLEISTSLLDKAHPFKCSYQTNICEAYVGLLSLGAKEEDQKKAEVLLKTFEEKCQNSPTVDSRGEYWRNRAGLTLALARLEKDGKKIEEAREWAAKAVKLLNTNGYVYSAAKTQIILGDIDLALAEVDQTHARRALSEFSAAKKTLKNYGICWQTELKEKMKRAKALSEK